MNHQNLKSSKVRYGTRRPEPNVRVSDGFDAYWSHVCSRHAAPCRPSPTVRAPALPVPAPV